MMTLPNSIASLLFSLLMVGAPALVQAQATTRVVEFEYDAATLLLKLERVDPSGTHCVETEYGYDEYGNKQSVTVRPCAHVVGTAQNFTPRVTVNTFAAKATGAVAERYPAGAYLTKTVARKADGSPAQESTFDYDPRFGTTIAQTEVALSDSTRNLSKRAVFDALGRLTQERIPVDRAANGATTEMLVEHQRVYCQGAFKPATPDPQCLNYSVTPASSVAFPSQMLADPVTGVILTRSPAAVPLKAVSAYFMRSTPKDATSAVIGARSVSHFDGLHRPFAKEAEAYDGRWSMSLTATNALGLEGAKWNPYFGRSASGAFISPPDELRQWTSAFDLLHRPVRQSQSWRASNGAAATVIDVQATYNGLESIATVPATSSPDGVARSKKIIKNAMGKVAQTVDAYGATINMAYDGAGNLVRTTDGMGTGNTTTIAYTATTARFKASISDPDSGVTSFTYDALGQLKSQTDAKNATTELDYDILGRMIERRNPSQNGNWYYDKDFAGVACASGLNRLCEARAGKNGALISSETSTYDNLGRPLQNTVNIDRAYVSAVTYDTLGRVSTYRYPTGFTLKNAYSTAAAGRIPGVLETVADNADATRIFWSVAGLGSRLRRSRQRPAIQPGQQHPRHEQRLRPHQRQGRSCCERARPLVRTRTRWIIATPTTRSTTSPAATTRSRRCWTASSTTSSSGYRSTASRQAPPPRPTEASSCSTTPSATS